MSSIISSRLDRRFGRGSRDRRQAAGQPGVEGARAALESFYHAFNERSLEVFDDVWAPDELVSLANPLGGLVRGRASIRELYARIFHGPAEVWVELGEVTEWGSPAMVAYSGRERGEYARNGERLPLSIRTSRVFAFLGSGLGWRQVHHHGSIDDPEALRRYQEAVVGRTP